MGQDSRFRFRHVGLCLLKPKPLFRCSSPERLRLTRCCPAYWVHNSWPKNNKPLMNCFSYNDHRNYIITKAYSNSDGRAPDISGSGLLNFLHLIYVVHSHRYLLDSLLNSTAMRFFVNQRNVHPSKLQCFIKRAIYVCIYVEQRVFVYAVVLYLQTFHNYMSLFSEA